MTADLFEGLTDGMVKKATPDRGGYQDNQHAIVTKSMLHPDLYDPVHSVRHKVNAASRNAYDRVYASPHDFGPVQEEMCNMCGSSGCACGDLTRY
jgi:hypothetical protein